MAQYTVDDIDELEASVGGYHSGIVSTSDFVEQSQLYENLIERIWKYHPNTDVSQIEKAYKIAYEAHAGQKRKSGEEYIIHPLCVATILADLEMDKETIIAGLLHDVVEDTVMSQEEIAREFSPEVALLVDGVTKLGQLSYVSDKVEVQAENLRKMFLAMAKDIRVIMIKLADRLHNMRTLKFMTREKQIEKARETQEIYAPLAQRLGISKIKVELDDLSLKYLEPDAYYELVDTIAKRKSEHEDYVQELVDIVKESVWDAGVKAEIYGREKHYFSIYRKMVTQGKTLDQIYDLFAVRVIVDSVKDCYAVLGVIHEMYTPIPGRFKDYIAMPKPNMYQSLHTTVIGPTGVPFEIQIRTWEMHRTSEYGIAAHWKYKESGEGSTVTGEEEKLSWLREILEWQQDMSDNKEFVSLLKSDLNLFSDTVFCFTPAGDVKNLPAGSNPIDFAYAIHSAVGNRMIGAKVNGKLVPIDYKISNGDRIEILTSANSKGPSRDWLNIVKSTQAKNKINQWFRSESKVDNVLRGKELLQNSAKSKGIEFSDINKTKYQERIMRKYGFHDWESCLATIGHGGLKEGQIVNRMYDLYKKDMEKTKKDEDILQEMNQEMSSSAQTKIRKAKSGITVKGVDDVSVRFSRCCNPVPGDEIVGFITRGRGISIHRTDCDNIVNLPNMERARLIDAEWSKDYLADKDGEIYSCGINVYSNNRVGLLVDITKIFTEKNIDIMGIHSSTSKHGIATIQVKFGITNRNDLQALIDKIKQIDGIMDVERVSG